MRLKRNQQLVPLPEIAQRVRASLAQYRPEHRVAAKPFREILTVLPPQSSDEGIAPLTPDLAILIPAASI